MARPCCIARRYIRDNHPQVNSWGAFQCYGLPTFMLGGRLRQPAGKKKPPVTKNGIIEQLRRIQTDAQTAEPARLKELIDELRRYDNALRDEWRTGNALYELGESYATLGELQLAIDLLRRVRSPPKRPSPRCPSAPWSNWPT